MPTADEPLGRQAVRRPRRIPLVQFSLGRLMLAVTVCAVSLGLGLAETFGREVWAVMALIVVLALFADWSVIHVQTGEAAFRRGDYAQAIRSYTRAIEGYPHDPHRYCRRAAALSCHGDRDAAIADFTAAVALDSRCAPAWSGRAALRFGQQQWREAIDDATVALCLTPEDGSMWLARGGSHGAIGEVDEAIADLDEALRIDPDQADGYFYRGHCRLVRREYAAALRDFDEAIRRGMDDPTTAASRATARFKLGEHRRAFEEIGECLARSPDNPEALWTKAWFLSTCPDDALRNGPLALDLARKAVALDGGQSCSCQSALAAAHAEVGLFDEAAEHARKALAQAPACMHARLKAILAACEARRPYRDRGRDADGR